MALLQIQMPNYFCNNQKNLLVHFVEDIALMGPVPYQWLLFFVQRYIKILNGFVRQKAKPEGSMSKGYLLQETIRTLHDETAQFDELAPNIWREKRWAC